MKTYELSYIITPDKNLEEAETIAKSVELFLQEKQGVILKSEKPVAKTFSYRIKKQSSGFFIFLEFQIEPEIILELKNKLEKDANILRHIITVKQVSGRLKKIRGEKKKFFEKTPFDGFENKTEEKTKKIPESAETQPLGKPKKTKPEKVEINDIDKQLDELLSE